MRPEPHHPYIFIANMVPPLAPNTITPNMIASTLSILALPAFLVYLYLREKRIKKALKELDKKALKALDIKKALKELDSSTDRLSDQITRLQRDLARSVSGLGDRISELDADVFSINSRIQDQERSLIKLRSDFEEFIARHGS
jgi:uncharacterized protein YoxC